MQEPATRKEPKRFSSCTQVNPAGTVPSLTLMLPARCCRRRAAHAPTLPPLCTYTQVNPAGTVPSLADASGKVLQTQSRAIVDFVDSLGDGPLGGKGADRSLVKTWIDKIDK